MKCPLKPIKTIIGASNVTKEMYDFSDLRQCIAYINSQQPYTIKIEFGECEHRNCKAYAPGSGTCRMMPG